MTTAPVAEFAISTIIGTACLGVFWLFTESSKFSTFMDMFWEVRSPVGVGSLRQQARPLPPPWSSFPRAIVLCY